MAMREPYRADANCQIVHDSILGRGLADPYLLLTDGEVAGYAGIWNKHYLNRVMEIYMKPAHRPDAVRIFRKFLETTRPTHIEAQTNMPFALTMLYDWSTNLEVENILFGDAYTSDLKCPGALFRRSRPEDRNENEWVLEANGEVVASGGYLCHYNPPYADVYMETSEGHRRKGYGSFFVQEVKNACREAGKTPAARCNPDNAVSRRTMEKAGLLPVGRMLVGEVALDGGTYL